MKPLRIAFLTTVMLAIVSPVFGARERTIARPPSPINVSAPREVSQPKLVEFGGNYGPAIVPVEDRFLAAWQYQDGPYDRGSVMTRIESDGSAPWGARGVAHGDYVLLATAASKTLTLESDNRCSRFATYCWRVLTAQIVDQDGAPTTGAITFEPGEITGLATASDGNTFAIAWQSVSGELFVTIMGLDGSILRPTMQNSLDGDFKELWGNRNGYLIFSSKSDGLYASRLAVNGSLSDTVLLDRDANSIAAIASNGRTFMIALGSINGVTLGFFDRELTALGERSPIDSTADRFAAASDPGGDYTFAYHTPAGIVVSRHTSSGERLFSPHLLLPGASSQFAIATNQQILAVVIADGRAEVWPFALEDLDPISTGVLSKHSNSQAVVNGACSPSDCAAVWSESDERGVAQLHATVIANDDTRVGEEIIIGDSASATIAFDGENYVIAWIQGESRIAARRLSRAGVLVDPAPFEVSNGGPGLESLSAVSADDEVLLVWSDYAVASASEQIFGARLRNGAVLDPGGKRLVPNSVSQTMPSVAWDGSAFMIAWQQQNIFVARLNHDAEIVSDHIPVANRPWDPTYQGGSSDSLNIQWNGSIFLLTWRTDDGVREVGEYHNIVRFNRVHAARVSREGNPLDGPLDANGFAITDWPVDAGPCSAAPFDDGFLVAWGSLPSAGELRAARVATNGTVPDGPGGVAMPVASIFPVLVGRADGSVRMFTVERVRDLIHGSAMRVFVRTVTLASVR